MDWESQLITLYLLICEEYRTKLWVTCERFTNGGNRSFSDEEVLVIYLVGVLRGFKEVKAIHRYAQDHLKELFPSLPQYPAFIHRVNRLSEAFRMLIEILQSEKVAVCDDSVYLVDSFPISLAKGQHAYTAKVAPNLASKSYNSTKKMYYYGVKAHVVARKREASLPDVEVLMIEEASRQDGPMFDQLRPMLNNNLVFGDKAYKRSDEHKIELAQNLKVLTPTIKTRGVELTAKQKAFSKAVSRMRQPIETLFGWINRITGIENASLIRSSAGLMTHIFGRIAGAMILKTMPQLDF